MDVCFLGLLKFQIFFSFVMPDIPHFWGKQ